MAKRYKREMPGFDLVEVKKVKVGHTFSNFDLAEVDQILQGTKFRNPKPPISFSINHDKKTIETGISKLPDDILQFIISFLTTREGARTSIISTRWSESVSCLDLHYANMTGIDYPKFTNKKSLTNERSNFTQRVDQVLQGCRSSRLDALRVSFLLGKESTAHIDKWMKLVATQGVKELELDFTPYRFYDADADYKFDVQGPSSSLKYLYLKCCIFDSLTNLKGFSSLVSMTLDDIFLTEYAVQNILSTCSLEWLGLKRCRFFSPTCLKFAGPSLLLKHLHISYNAASVKKIDLHDINLLSFELDGFIETLSIENSPHLTRFVLAWSAPVEVLTSVPHLEMLFIIGWFEGTLPRLCVFNNLKRLLFLANHDTPNLCQFVYLLEPCPLLQKLELDDGECWFTAMWIRLKFAGPSLLLKHLHISYSVRYVKKIDLHDINLLSFELDGHIETLSIENAPHLTRLVLATPAPVEVLTSVPHLEMLFMTGWFKGSVLHDYERGTLPRLCVFNNLKRLVFLANNGTPDLRQFVYLLEACPLLQKLELDMGISGTREHWFIEELIKMTSIEVPKLT